MAREEWVEGLGEALVAAKDGETGGAEASAQMRGTVRPRPAILRLLADALGGLAES